MNKTVNHKIHGREICVQPNCVTTINSYQYYVNAGKPLIIIIIGQLGISACFKIDIDELFPRYLRSSWKVKLVKSVRLLVSPIIGF